jgi:hypothetical protein
MKLHRIGLILLFVPLGWYKANSQQIEIIKGDLYFVLIDFTRFFDTPDSLAHVEEREINRYDSLHKGDMIVKFYRELKESNLLRVPQIVIIDEHGATKKVLVDRADFVKMERFYCWELIDEGRKVSIEVPAKKTNIKTFTLYQATGPLTYKIVDGKTKHN